MVINATIIMLYREGYTYREIANYIKSIDNSIRIGEDVVGRRIRDFRNEGLITEQDEEIRKINLPIREEKREKENDIANYIPEALELLGKDYSKQDVIFLFKLLHGLSTRETKDLLEMIEKGGRVDNDKIYTNVSRGMGKEIETYLNEIQLIECNCLTYSHTFFSRLIKVLNLKLKKDKEFLTKIDISSLVNAFTLRKPNIENLGNMARLFARGNLLDESINLLRFCQPYFESEKDKLYRVKKLIKKLEESRISQMEEEEKYI